MSSHDRTVLIAILAIVYFISGFLGLSAAIPPGYATLIWPPSGIAIGALILAGPRIWPGVFIAATALNIFQAEVISLAAMTVAIFIAVGSTLQSIAGAWLARRMFGKPMTINSARDAFVLMIFTGPIVCMVAASVGQTVLFTAGIVRADTLLENWLTWYLGDMFGVLVFLPLILLSPWRPNGILMWKRSDAVRFSLGALTVVVVSIVLTFYLWLSIGKTMHSKSQDSFRSIAEDNERALLHRMKNYEIVLEAGAGFYTADTRVTATDWQTFTEAMRIEETLPGINGVGFIEPVSRDNVNDFYDEMTARGHVDMRIHPETEDIELFIINMIEPLVPNRQALGLNIAFEANRYHAAVTARDTGVATITRRIFLVQDNIKRAGFLLLRPLYAKGAPTDTVENRRAFFRGWIYAPFIGQRFVADLTPSQNASLTISVYDGVAADPDMEIFSSASQHIDGVPPQYRIQKTVPITNHEWTIVWESTPAFEASVRRREAELVLFSGLALTLLLSLLLLSFSRREASIQEKVIEKTSELAAREIEYAAIFDTAAAAILLLDASGNILTTNSIARDIYEAHKRDTIFDILTDFEMGALLREKMSSDTHHRQVLSALGAGGADLFVEFEANMWATAGGETRFTVILLDATEETKIAAELAESEVRLDFTLTGTGVGIFDMNLSDGTLTVSETWREIFGFTDVEKIEPHKELLQRIHPDDVTAMIRNNRRCILGQDHQSSTEYRIKRTDGEVVWVRSVAFVSKRDKNGSGLRLTGTLVDIDDHKRALNALQISEARFRSTIESAPIGTVLVDSDGAIFDVNDAFCTFLGYDQNEMKSLHFNELIAQNVNGQIAVSEQMTRFDTLHQSDLLFRRKDDQLVWGLLTSSKVDGADQQDSHHIVQILDVNERRKVDEMKRDFIATVSHELRTPLTSVRSSLGMLRLNMGPQVTEVTERLIVIAQNNCDRLTGLVNDILDIEKLGSQKMHIDLSPVDTVEIVGQIVADTAAYAAERGVTIRFDAPQNTHYASSNRNRFAQVLTNLLANAIKFSSIGGIVSVCVEEKSEGIEISVIDNGDGIPKDFYDRIFTKFAQANSSNTRNTGGTGLGLSISKELVEGMGGQIGFTSKKGHGSTFWFRFPSVNVA